MSEKESIKPEVFEEGPKNTAEQPPAKQERSSPPSPEVQTELLKAARAEVDKQSTDQEKLAEKLKVEAETPAQEVEKRPAGSELKGLAFEREIRHIRRKLAKPDQFGSKVVHQKFISQVSEVAAKTITRPSGLLGGGITAFIGTTSYLLLTKYIGLKYNYSVFLALLVAGFVLGLIIEAVFRLVKGRRSA